MRARALRCVGPVELHLSSPATTALIDRLDKSGHVVRERQGTDRRQVQLRMTPKAYRDGGAMFRPLAGQMGAAMAEFTADELLVATRFLNAMIEATVRAGEEAARGPLPQVARNSCRFEGPKRQLVPASCAASGRGRRSFSL
jgi:hypothetical protein